MPYSSTWRLTAALLSAAIVLPAPALGQELIPDPEPTIIVSPGFRHLLDMAPDIVGRPLASERFGDTEGSTLVPTTTGILYWEHGLAPTWTNGFARLTLDEDAGDAHVTWESLDALAPPPREPEYFVAAYTVWDSIAACESNGRWNVNTGNGFYGGVQFDYGSWLAAGGGKYALTANLATRPQQIEIANNWLRLTSWRSWPYCSRKLGLR